MQRREKVRQTDHSTSWSTANRKHCWVTASACGQRILHHAFLCHPPHLAPESTQHKGDDALADFSFASLGACLRSWGGENASCFTAAITRAWGHNPAMKGRGKKVVEEVIAPHRCAFPGHRHWAGARFWNCTLTLVIPELMFYLFPWVVKWG